MDWLVSWWCTVWSLASHRIPCHRLWPSELNQTSWNSSPGRCPELDRDHCRHLRASRVDRATRHLRDGYGNTCDSMWSIANRWTLLSVESTLCLDLEDQSKAESVLPMWRWDHSEWIVHRWEDLEDSIHWSSHCRPRRKRCSNPRISLVHERSFPQPSSLPPRMELCVCPCRNAIV